MAHSIKYLRVMLLAATAVALATSLAFAGPI